MKSLSIVCAGFFCGFFVVQAVAANQSPLIQYKTSSDAMGRKLIFVNNPEIVRAQSGMCDIADNLSFAGTQCARSLHKVSNAFGAYRDWFEHLNRTGAPLSYAVRVRNEGEKCAEVIVRGSGYSRNGIAEGGLEFVQLFSSKPSVPVEVCPGESYTVTKIPLENAVAVGKFFTGVVDFEIAGAPLSVENLAFHNAPALDLKPIGYVTRVDFPAHESLVYKGVSDHTQAVASDVDFSFNDSTPVGRLSVRYPRYQMPKQTADVSSEGRCSPNSVPLCSGQMGYFLQEQENDHWVTHIAPDPEDSNPKRKDAVVTDIVTLVTPGFPAGCEVESPNSASQCFVMSPFYKWYYPDFKKWKYPNWGNWAVHYVLSGTLSNEGMKSRTVHFGLRADGNSPIAYRAHNTAWKYFPLVKADNNNPNDYFPYSKVVVPAGKTVPYQVEYVLSGPAAGTLQNLVKIID